jgi:hypothetical protein
MNGLDWDASMSCLFNTGWKVRFILFCCCFVLFFETGYARLDLNLRSSYLSLLSAGIIGMYHHAWQG